MEGAGGATCPPRAPHAAKISPGRDPTGEPVNPGGTEKCGPSEKRAPRSAAGTAGGAGAGQKKNGGRGEEEAENGGGVHGTSTGRPVGLHWTPAQREVRQSGEGFRDAPSPIPPRTEERARGSGGRAAREGGPLGESPRSGRRPAGRRRGAGPRRGRLGRPPATSGSQSRVELPSPPPGSCGVDSTRSSCPPREPSRPALQSLASPGRAPGPGATSRAWEVAACPRDSSPPPPPFPERALSRRTPRRTLPPREMRVPDVKAMSTLGSPGVN